MSGLNVHKGHRQRLRDRAASEGLDAFEPHQVLELLLFYAIPRQDTSDVAHLLIRRFRTVQNVLTAPKEELMEVPGVGERVADWLLCLGEAAQSYGELRAEDHVRIRNYEAAFKFCEMQRKKVLPNRSYQLCMTPSGKVQSFELLCDSTAWGDALALRKGLESAMSMHTRCAIVIIFTEDADPEASEYDLRFAAHYEYVLRVMGCELLDVILVGPTRLTSLRQCGGIAQGEARSQLSSEYLRESEDALLEFYFQEEPQETE